MKFSILFVTGWKSV